LIAQWLSERLEQLFSGSRPGAATNIAAEVVVRAPPDRKPRQQPIVTAIRIEVGTSHVRATRGYSLTLTLSPSSGRLSVIAAANILT
jgi:hypothetical protein